MKKHALRTAMAISLMLMVQKCACIAADGDEFVGSWQIKNSYNTLSITKSGNYFIIDDGSQKINAIYGDGALKVPGKMGIVLATLKSPAGAENISAAGDQGAKLMMSSKEYTRLAKMVAPLGNGLDMANQILGELRQLDHAIDQWAIDNGKNAGEKPTPADLKKYIQPGSWLYDALGDKNGPKDPLGNAYEPFAVDRIPKVNPASFAVLSDVADANFWAPFK